MWEAPLAPKVGWLNGCATISMATRLTPTWNIKGRARLSVKVIRFNVWPSMMVASALSLKLWASAGFALDILGTASIARSQMQCSPLPAQSSVCPVQDPGGV
jgi:hypothetical protein